jgi:uncharacterized membrane protein YcaP (DUF421 family)
MEWIRSVIGPDESAEPWQICVRAIIVFAFGLVCVRIAGRRTFAQATPLDIIVAIVVGSNLSRIMTGRASFFGGLAASLLVVVLHRALAMATLRWNGLATFLKGTPVELVRDGQIDWAMLRRHGLSREDLEEGLRMEQEETSENVRLATLEAGGKISVIRKDGQA